jgi:hypothetical protein
MNFPFAARDPLEGKRQLQKAFDDVLTPLGVRAPAPEQGESPDRCRLRTRGAQVYRPAQTAPGRPRRDRARGFTDQHRRFFFRALDMSETIPRSEAPDDPLRAGALSKRSDAEKAQRRADAEAPPRRAQCRAPGDAGGARDLWRVLREFMAARPDFQDRPSANLALERL